MPRTLRACAVLAVLALPCRADQTISTTETLIKLTVSPAPAPKPALRYLLLPDLKEMNPGNPCYNYLKCFMTQEKYFNDKEAVERREKLLAMPLKELPAQELLDYGGFTLRQADWAARLDNPDWEILLRLKADHVGVLLPDVMQLGHLGTALKVRFRAEVALGRFDDALRSAKTMFALSRHLGEHPTFVGNLEGFTIARMAISPLEEMLEQPGCPNLYWALTNLPSPLVRLDMGMEGERGLSLWAFRELDESAPMSADQLKSYIAPLDRFLQLSNPVKPGEVRAWLDIRVKDEGLVRAARRRLVEHGLPEERVLRFPADQVILLVEKLEFEIRRDEILKLINLPPWQAIALGTNVEPGPEAGLFVKPLVGGLQGLTWGPARLDQRIALLRHVEALRLYAADHEGTLPAQLSEISVPLPNDPYTGKPFRYEKNAGTAHLRGTSPPGEEKTPVFNIHYEITLKGHVR